MSKVIVLDGGGCQFRAIFCYRGNLVSQILTIIGHPKSKDKLIVDFAQEIMETMEFFPEDIEMLLNSKRELTNGIPPEEFVKEFKATYKLPPVYTYLRMAIGYLKQLKFSPEDLVVVAQDFGSWRKEKDPMYKAQRQEARESKGSGMWWKQRYAEFNDLYDKLSKGSPWHLIKSYKMESDDIGSVCCRYYKDSEVILCSSDRDWEMLTYFPNVKIFSPITKKFKKDIDPMKVLLEKIQGDVSDNLIVKPKSEKAWEIRKEIVNLQQLPQYVERQVWDELDKIHPKNLKLELIPFKSVREEFKKLYYTE